jgi:hypothetical protein
MRSRLIESRSRRIAAAVLVAVVVVGGGCQDGQRATKSRTGAERLISDASADQLRLALIGFSDRFATKVSAAASDMAWQTDDRRLRELTLRWRMRTIPTMRQLVFLQDPRLALLDVWILTVQMSDYAEFSDPASSFGAFQDVAIDVCKTLEEYVAAIASEFVAEDHFEEAREAVEAFARANPIRRGFASEQLDAADRNAARRTSGLGDILTIPLSGVSESATALDRIASVAAVFTELIDDLPQYVRWQAELLLIELDSMSAVTQARDDFERLSASVATIAESTKSLPAELREQVSLALDDLDEKQEGLQTTVRDLESAIAKATDLVVRTGEVSSEMTGTAQALESVVLALHALPEAFKSENPDPLRRRFDITDYTAAAEAIGVAVREMRSLTDDLEAGKLTGAFAGFDDTSRTSIDHATGQMETLIDRLTFRGFLIVGVLLAGLFAYGMVFVRRRSVIGA